MDRNGEAVCDRIVSLDGDSWLLLCGSCGHVYRWTLGSDERCPCEQGAYHAELLDLTRT